jgi:uncharacterized membrane protein
MQASNVSLALAVFLASAVESVEALTIVVAAGVSRGWRSALEGAASAVALLAVVVGALGPALVYLVPIDVLRGVVGALLLIFGLQWLRKAVLRAVGLKAKHDEDAIFKAQVEALSNPYSGVAGAQGVPNYASASYSPGTQRRKAKRDSVGFTVAFKGTFLEGMEVAIIVLGLGGGDHDLGLAGAAAAAAALVVAGIGALVARQLSGVPENAMKTVVGLMLVSFGTFWAGEGLGARWPGGDLAILVLVGAYALFTWAIVQAMRAMSPPAAEKLAARAGGGANAA